MADVQYATLYYGYTPVTVVVGSALYSSYLASGATLYPTAANPNGAPAANPADPFPQYVDEAELEAALAGLGGGPSEPPTELPNLKSLNDFFTTGDADWTSAFSQAATWSANTRTPVYVPSTPSPYMISAPITLTAGAQLIGSNVPTYGPIASPSSSRPLPLIRAAATFPNNRGLVEIAPSARSTALRGLILDGSNVGTGIHGVVFPANGSGSELGTVLEDLVIGNCSGDGIRGSGWVVFLDHLMLVLNAGYGINITAADQCTDNRLTRIYAHYNRLGGLNVDGVLAASTISHCRFERSGQTYNDPQNDQQLSTWNPSAPGIRIRNGYGNTFVQCDTDANNGPGLDIRKDTSTSTTPSGYTFIACGFNRDGQGNGKTTSTTNAGVVIKGYANSSGQTVPHIRFVEVSTSSGPSNDGGDATYINPNFAIQVENTEFFYMNGGKAWANGSSFTFGSGTTDPTVNNWKPFIMMPDDGAMVTGSGGITKIQQITQSAYTALGTKDSATLYVIVG